ncbi:hypothetical protein MAR_005806 [Mya arenaria]|uniref:Tyr recombinase domain-containing protein n=1 Tax=Mya arenaria TaxID=6604 RepID=A0ABY7F8S7_MYAAR|nr:hypothetical protein MAR_005806 [Mya arenaria]
MASWRTSTQKTYSTYIKRWLKFTKDSHIKPFNPTEVQFVSFLTGLFKDKLSYDSLGTARSAVNQLLSICGGQDFSNSLLIHKSMKGFFELKPYFPKYVQIWDVKTVLNYLKQLPENLTLLNLSCKLCMLFWAATRDTVSQWIKTVLIKAKVGEQYKPHSVRAASASAAKYNAVTLNTIIKTAGWSNATMFARFYNKPIGQKQKTECVTGVK